MADRARADRRIARIEAREGAIHGYGVWLHLHSLRGEVLGGRRRRVLLRSAPLRDIAREAARLRAATRLSMPDALIVASALVVDVDLLVTGDRSWSTLDAHLTGGLRSVLLA